MLSPSTPPAPCRLIVPQVFLRNSGVSRCANDVKRTFRSNSAFLVIWASCVDTFSRLRVYGSVSPAPVSLCPAPSPCTRLSRAPSIMGESDFHRRISFPQMVSFGWPTRPHANQDGGGSPRFLPLPFPDVPCSQPPPQSPAIIATSDRLL